MTTLTILDEGRPLQADAVVGDDDVRIPTTAVESLGWAIEPQGLCRGDVCIPIRDPDLVTAAGVSLPGLAAALGRPLAVDPAAGAAYLGTAAADRAAALAGLDAPDFTLPDLDDAPHSLADHRGTKVLLAAWASWWGCRYDLPGWQEIHEELDGLTVITVALDRAEDARRWIERAEPTHPSLVDEAHVVADRYHMVNVPTVVWIDEEGRIARPNDVAFTTEQGGKYAGVSTTEQMERLRRWVAGDLPPADPREQMAMPSPDAQLARAHFGLGWWLHEHGRAEAARRHFATAGELAPDDFTIRRGTMRLRDADPFGPEFMQMVADWHAAGNSYYLPIE